MFTNSTLNAEIEYRANRVRQDWTPRRRRITLPKQGRRLHAGRPGAVAAAR